MRELTIGLEMGGTKLQAALGTPSGELLSRRRGEVRPVDGARAILEWFIEPVRDLFAESPRYDGKVTRIAAGFGGPVETATGTALTSHQVEGWKGFSLKPWFEEHFGVPAYVFNDSSAAGWAEYCLGAGQGTRHFMYSNIGSGIGGAIVIDGQLQDGQGFGAAEVGHTYVPDWEAAEPGVPRKLEQLCSGWAIERRMRAAPNPPDDTPLGVLCGGRAEAITCAMLGQAAEKGDATALAEIERVAKTVGLALANAVTLFHPERIAMGGGVSLMGDILLDPIRRWANHYAFGPFQGKFEIVPCALGESVVLVGAILLAGGAKE